MRFAPAAAITLAILALAVAVASAQRLRRVRETSSSNYLTKEEHWMNQTIDHFSPYVSSFASPISLFDLFACCSWFFYSRIDWGLWFSSGRNFSYELQLVID